MSTSSPTTGWTFNYLGADGALYVYLCRAGDSEHPVAFPLAAVGPAHRAQLRSLVRGDRVPEELMEVLLRLAPPRPLAPLP